MFRAFCTVAALLLATTTAMAAVPFPKPRPNIKAPVAASIPLPTPRPAQAKPELRAELQKPRLYACPVKERIGGSCPNVIRAYQISKELGYSPLQDQKQVEKFIGLGLLHEVKETDTLRLKGVKHPYARPALFTFLGRFSKQYFEECKEPLVVTSLARTEDDPPENGSEYTVHPMGMAADLSFHRNTCRKWIEKTLLALEARDVLDVTRERKPAHYHLVVFPTQYETFIKGQNVAKQ